MNTNKVNAQNPAFFADLHAAFDRLDPDEACRRANPTHDFLKNRRLGSAS
jgi:hypothetical protein